MKSFKLLIVGILILAVSGLGWAAAKAYSVQVKKGQLRSKPTFFGKVVKNLKYGDRVQGISEKGPWRKVKAAKGTGWIHSSSLTKKTIVLTSGKKQAKVGASSDEMVLAGKGFNKQMEKQYRSKNKGLNYTWVDKAEKNYPTSSKQILAFINQGKLKPSASDRYKNKTAPTQQSGGSGGESDR